MAKIEFNTLRNHCIHQGYFKNGVRMCGFKDGKSARCWADWQECQQENCPLISKRKIARPRENCQLSIFDFIKEES